MGSGSSAEPPMRQVGRLKHNDIASGSRRSHRSAAAAAAAAAIARTHPRSAGR